MATSFKQFISRGSVLDLAVGVVIGAAFGKIVSTMVDGVLMPPIGMALGKIDFSSLFVVLDTAKGVPASLADAKAKGIPVIAYGQLMTDIISFLIVAFAVFMIVRAVQRPKPEAPAGPPTKKTCPECFSEIDIRPKRCPNCTSQMAA